MKSDRKVMYQVMNLATPPLCALILLLSNVGFSGSVFGSSYRHLLSPNELTFAIWGPIFLFQAAFYFYQARDILRPAEEKLDMPYVLEVGPFFMLSWLSSSLWYILWASGMVWPAIAAMYAYLLTTLGAYLGLGINLRGRPIRDHIFVTVGWSMLTGWVTVATIVNTTTGLALSGFEPGPLGEAGWAAIFLVIVLGIYLTVLYTRNDYVFTGVGAWAVLGILIERLNPVNPTQPLVVLVAAAGLVVVIGAVIFRVVRQQRTGKFHLLPTMKTVQ